MSICPVQRGFRSWSALCFSPSPLSECTPVSLPWQRMPCLRLTTLWLWPGGHMSHSESSLPEYLLIGLHLRYSGRVSPITFISQYGFGLVGFRIWLVVRTSRPDGPTTSQGLRPTLLVAGFRSSRSFLDLFRSVQSLLLCPSALLSHVLPHSLCITVPHFFMSVIKHISCLLPSFLRTLHSLQTNLVTQDAFTKQWMHLLLAYM